MGRNTAIKRYDATRPGQPLELLSDKHAHLPVVLELLKSPWLVRAVDLVRHDDLSATKRRDEPVSVIWDSERQYPTVFVRGRVRYRIDAVVQVWAADRSWWDPRRRISRRYWRVLAKGGIYDLAYDRASGEWLLVGIQD